MYIVFYKGLSVPNNSAAFNILYSAMSNMTD